MGGWKVDVLEIDSKMLCSKQEIEAEKLKVHRLLQEAVLGS